MDEYNLKYINAEGVEKKIKINDLKNIVENGERLASISLGKGASTFSFALINPREERMLLRPPLFENTSGRRHSSFALINPRFVSPRTCQPILGAVFFSRFSSRFLWSYCLQLRAVHA